MKKKNRTKRKEKCRALRPWKGLTIWCLVFAMIFSITAPAMHILDNDFMLCLPGASWKMENADSSAIYFPTAIADEEEWMAGKQQ